MSETPLLKPEEVQWREEGYHHLPPFVDVGGISCPSAPTELRKTGIESYVLSDLALKLANTVPEFNTIWAARKLCLPIPLVEELLEGLESNKMVEVLGQTGTFNYRFTITKRGRDQAYQAMQNSGYIGPAPVSVEAYSAMLAWQMAHRPEVTYEDVKQAISHLVLADDVTDVAALAASSGRSLFLFGPPGNGKTSLGRSLHNTKNWNIWIPYAFYTGNNVVQLFDRHCHETVLDFSEDELVEQSGEIDQRWIRIRRPFVVVGGEMTIDQLDLAWSGSHRFYEAPLHVKANGGTFLIDDFGRQRVNPTDLLNRWIIPMEHQVDHLTLTTGQKIEVPFLLMLMVATNLTVSDVADPAFLRRMGYRLHVPKPTTEQYVEIFRRYAKGLDLEVPEELLSQLLQRYNDEGRELRCCEPRDLLERVKDLCELRKEPLQLTPKNLNVAWKGYFGHTD